MDEYCISMSVETRRSYADKGSKENQVKSLDTSREMSGIGVFNLGLVEQPRIAYAIIPLSCRSSKEDGKTIFNVREARSRVLREEAESYPKNVRVYYWPSGMCREPVFDAFVEDFINDCKILEIAGDKLLSMDWYDSHVQRKSLVKLFDANIFAMFTENDCTDILAMPDGGAIQILKNRINSIIERTVDKDVDAWFGVTPPSKSLRRRTTLRALSEAWIWFREAHRSTPHRIALRTGQIFKLNEDRKVQFQESRFRGYENEDKSPKSPFEDKTFVEAHVEYVRRNSKRRKDQAERKRKREMEAKIKEQKKKVKKIKKMERKKKGKRISKKKRSKKKIIIKEESKSPTLGPAVGNDIPIAVPQPPPAVNKVKRNIQREAFEDKRVLTEDFLHTL